MKDVLYTVSEHIATITLNAPDRLNAVTAQMLRDLADAVERAGQDPGVRVVALTGAGRGFCSGATLSGPGALEPAASDPVGPDEDTLDGVERAIRALHACTRPTVALVPGVAAGVGVSLALVCDYVLASDRASFVLAFARIGLMPDGGATALVAASIGRARALRLALTGEKLEAATAQSWGLIAECVEHDAYADRSADLLRTFAAGPTLAHAASSAAINAATLDLEAALARESAGQAALIGTDDAREGIGAFLAKRPAVFTGR